jgi:hypothetical protein
MGGRAEARACRLGSGNYDHLLKFKENRSSEGFPKITAQGAVNADELDNYWSLALPVST